MQVTGGENLKLGRNLNLEYEKFFFYLHKGWWHMEGFLALKSAQNTNVGAAQ